MITTSKRYEANPFLKELVIKGNSKQVIISPLGKDNNILVNQITGEVTGTSVVTYKKVDEHEFVKLFTANIGLTFNLTSAGIKAFNILMFAVQRYCIGKDRVSLDSHMLNDFLKENDSLKISLPTFRRGISELEKASLIAKTTKLGDYFINPNFMFNGNRIAFTTMIEKIEKQENTDAPNQMSIEEQIDKGIENKI